MQLSISLSIKSILGKGHFIESLLPKHTKLYGNSLAKSLQMISHSPISGIELVVNTSTTERDILKVKKQLEQYKLKILTIHQPNIYLYHIPLKVIEKLCVLANISGSRVIVLHINAIDYLFQNSSLTKRLQFLQQKYKISFSIENSERMPLFYKSYWWEGKLFSTLVKSKSFNITMDVSHLGKSKENVVEFFKNNKNTIKNIQLSDYGKKTHLVLGKGNLPLDTFLKTLRSLKYKGFITFEINSSLENIIENSKLVSKYLRIKK